jgi:hypothetical protein
MLSRFWPWPALTVAKELISSNPLMWASITKYNLTNNRLGMAQPMEISSIVWRKTVPAVAPPASGTGSF